MSTPKRPAMTKARRARIWMRDDGLCYLCGLKIGLGEAYDIEHVIPWALSFDDSDENLKLAHKEGCHKDKSRKDVKAIAKAKRMAGEHGQQARRKKENYRPMPSRGFDKTVTRGFDGKVRKRKK